jgi:hypothetical protein
LGVPGVGIRGSRIGGWMPIRGLGSKPAWTGSGAMSGTRYVRVSREYVQAKRAYENSTERLKRTLKGRIAANARPRRPVGAPRTVNLPRELTGSFGISKTQTDLHLNAFAAYVEAYREYYRGRPGELPGAIRAALNLRVHAKMAGFKDADSDLQKFAAALMEEHCSSALRAYKRARTPESTAALLLAHTEASRFDARDIPSFAEAQREVDKLAGEI